MKNFNHNFSNTLLLANQKVQIWSEDLNFNTYFIPMSVLDIFTNYDLIWFLNFLQEDLSEIKKIIPDYELKNHYSFITLICSLSDTTNDAKKLSDKFIKSLKIMLPDIELKNKIMTINGIPFSEDIYNIFLEIVFKTMHIKQREEILEDDDPMTIRMKELKNKAQKIRQKNKKNVKGTEFEDMFASIIYEFPQYKLEDLFKLNIYTFYYLFKYVGKIANYEVSKIAAGNGLTKKHKYFIEK